MKKILQIVDIYGWAIDELAKSVVEYNPQYEWRRMAIHPKGLQRGEIDLAPIKEAIEWADVIDCQYWRTLSQLAEMIPELKKKKVMLTHHNEKNILSEPWDYVDRFIVTTQRMSDILSEKYPKEKISYTIHNSFEHKRFIFNPDYPPKNDRPVVGYTGRITAWKGLKEILQVCYELDYTCLIMGKMDSREYWDSIPAEHKEKIDWSFFECKDEDVPNFYKEIDIYVGYSGSGRETGPLGLIEAMASGVPCVTTLSGIANDICEDQDSALVVDFDDYDGLKEQMQNLIESAGLRNTIRNGGWDAIRNHNHQNRARKISREIDKLLYDDDLVSIIIPATYTRLKEVKEILSALEEQTYKSFEVMLIWDEISPNVVINPQDYSFAMTIRFTDKQGYNLAMSRNIGVIYSGGKYLMFCDSRLYPDKDAIKQFLKKARDRKYEDKKAWFFGEKGGNKETFVENFSFIKRINFIAAGMNNERINGYGGMSQELRERFNSQGFEFVYVPDAKCKQLITARKDTDRRQSIINMKNLLSRLYG